MYHLEKARGPRPPNGSTMRFAGLDLDEEVLYLASATKRQAVTSAEETAFVGSQGSWIPVDVGGGAPDAVDLLDNGFLLARRHRAAGGADSSPEHKANAWILDQNGEVEERFSLGPQFSCVVAGRDGNLWAGYSDQTTLPSQPRSVDAASRAHSGPTLMPGLACWTSTGLLSWLLPEDPKTEQGLFHCYALNSGVGGIFAAVGPDGLVCEVDSSGVVNVHRSPVMVPAGLAYDGNSFFFLGRYEPKKRHQPVTGFDVITVARLIDGELTIIEATRLVMPDGSPMPRFPRGVVNRGRTILMHFDDPAEPYFVKF